MNRKNKKGFTLLEIIIVIIIIGVLAGLALPRLLNTVGQAYSTEAFSAIATIRSAMDRCHLKRGGNYGNCEDWANLDIENPENSPGAHFTFSIGGGDSVGYTITATRNTVDDGDNSSDITITQTSVSVTKVGTGIFEGI